MNKEAKIKELEAQCNAMMADIAKLRSPEDGATEAAYIKAKADYDATVTEATTASAAYTAIAKSNYVYYSYDADLAKAKSNAADAAVAKAEAYAVYIAAKVEFAAEVVAINQQ